MLEECLWAGWLRESRIGWMDPVRRGLAEKKLQRTQANGTNRLAGTEDVTT